jgi:hypothetical protein
VTSIYDVNHVYAVVGPNENDAPDQLLEVFTGEDEAEAFLGSQMLNGVAASVSRLAKVGQFSVLMTRGDRKGHPMIASWAITNDGMRDSREYRVERLVANRAVVEA